MTTSDIIELRDKALALAKAELEVNGQFINRRWNLVHNCNVYVVKVRHQTIPARDDREDSETRTIIEVVQPERVVHSFLEEEVRGPAQAVEPKGK